eukprot:CAMPEP_0201146388 /NCGR_PEP_ID=MMETSP0851-20130426/8078_1 /ASSEMBLY_ACC=CAM_ASM_000631 /TAXON_ID=183588 /ORGANISM="Pseudo-nitzschia fraudulenta, Strain WWA7" /LENGTH=158 /DNA_ID=CAMNT_0047421925 /DNA_START=1020 /DNA_END=1496 /DNA_ORIENTATION=+
MVLNLLKNTASLTRDHQHLHEDFIDHAKDIDVRMSTTETVTSQITTTLADTIKTFASLQTSVTNFQVQINASTETQISERCDQAVTAAIAQLLDKFHFATNKRTRQDSNLDASPSLKKQAPQTFPMDTHIQQKITKFARPSSPPTDTATCMILTIPPG